MVNYNINRQEAFDLSQSGLFFNCYIEVLEKRMSEQLSLTSVALAGIWIAVAVISIFSPDLVSGSQQDHVPVAAILTWIWGVMATTPVLNEMVRPATSNAVRRGIAYATVIIWIAVAATSVFGPELVTGSDPTRLPIAAIFAPIAGALVTGIVCALMRLLVGLSEAE